MKLASNCSLLAAALSSSYRTYNEFPPNGSLETFLAENGILLTMCMRYSGIVPWLECTRAADDAKLSASWVQADKTKGFRVIGKPVDLGPPIGLVLKPTATKIRCMYPFNAATNGRDEDGCGPPTFDPKYGSEGYDHGNWIGKMIYRQQVIQYRNSEFGKNRTFESIPCSEFLPLPPGASEGIIGFLDQNQSKHDTMMYQTQAQLVIDQWSYVMGQPVCNQSEPAPKPDFSTDKMALVYDGPKFWKSNEWPEVVQFLEDALDKHPDIYVWNELVLDVPTGSEEEFANQTVQAVFYIQGNGVVADEVARRLARREATKMQKPLMHIDLNKEDEDLFRCSNNEYEEEEGGEEDVVAAPRKGSLRSSVS